MTAKVLLLTALAACAYDAHYEDCTIRCAPSDNPCPDGLTCGSKGLCRTSSDVPACSTLDASGNEEFPSCLNLAKSCGADGTDDCCSTAQAIPGGTYYRSYDVAGDGLYPSTNYPATVRAFVLDRYEVTVGRFRKFVEAGGGTRTNPPAPGTAARILNGASGQGGWDASWNTNLAADSGALAAALKCDASFQSWTDAPDANEQLPIGCLTWYEAFAFCAWDGGFLPTEAEWNFAAAGGAEQRAYPWSNPSGSIAIDCSYTNYNQSGTFCVSGGVNRVGSESPKGDGKWGHADLAGNVWELTLDWHMTPYPTTACDDCANLTTATGRAIRGGSFREQAPGVRGAGRDFPASSQLPTARFSNVGVRCGKFRVR